MSKKFDCKMKAVIIKQLDFWITLIYAQGKIMIINCTYTTEADNGNYETNAKWDTKTLEVIEIESSNDEDAESIESVLAEKVSFNYLGTDYEFLVRFNDSDYVLDESQDLSVFDKINLHNNLDSNLKEKTDKKTKKKI